MALNNADACVGHQEINWPQSFARSGNHGVNARRVGDVALDKNALNTFLLDFLLSVECIFVTAEIVDRNIGALPSQSERNCSTNTTRATGNECCLACQIFRVHVELSGCSP